MIWQATSLRERPDDRLRRLPLVKSEPLKVWFDSALVGVMVAVAIVGACVVLP